MVKVTKQACSRCGGDILLKEGAVYRDYCSDCKSAMRVNFAVKLASDRRLRTLKKREIETLK